MSTLIHGHRTRTYTSPTYYTWQAMIKRCYYPKHKSFSHYGGRGITVCERWKDFRNFFVDMGPRPEGMTLDRLDVNGHYCKDNCKWATKEEQEHNKRKYVGQFYLYNAWRLSGTNETNSR